MPHKNLVANGLTGGPSMARANVDKLFVFQLDGEGETEEARVAWLKRLFPTLADKFEGHRDIRACIPVTDGDIRKFRPKHAKAIGYETMGVKFPPKGCGKWNDLPLLMVNSGRQTCKLFRAVNVKRIAEGSPVLDGAVVVGKKFETAADRNEARVVENARLVERTPMQRAWDAQRLLDDHMTDEDVMPLVGVKTATGLRNLIALLDGSQKVRDAVDLGPDEGGITQSAAIDIIKAHKDDHAAQDAELARRLGAATGKTGREKQRAIRGNKGPVPVRANVVAKFRDELTTLGDDKRIAEIRAVVGALQGDPECYDALPDDVLRCLMRAEKARREGYGGGEVILGTMKVLARMADEAEKPA